MYSPFVCNVKDKHILQEQIPSYEPKCFLTIKIYYVFEMTVNIPVIFGE
ncbi:hypothetical protein BACERE00185_04692 [Bacillus mobilis]|uniref:Uncharacterized protein n=1 Tax=Bacillus mobilis TaxID=2026190 RepID=A0A1Y6AIU5_9BACI|nr:hypothetical protein BACERE00185_04692 [Bacillus mobilis]